LYFKKYLAFKLKLFRFSSDPIQKMTSEHQNSGLNPQTLGDGIHILICNSSEMLVPGMNNLKKDLCSEAVKNTK